MTSCNDLEEIAEWLRDRGRVPWANRISQLAEQLKEADPTPLDMRILCALGGLRDDMPPEDVAAVQRFVDTLRTLSKD